MTTRLLLACSAMAALAIVPGCRSAELVVPEATETLPVSVQHRTKAEGESTPTIHVSPSAGSVTIRVTRHALCGTLVSAAVHRGVGEIDVVSRLSNNPSALCAATIPDFIVVDYSGTVSSLAAGTYRIRVFEGEGYDPPRFVGSVSVTVAPPAA